MLHEIKSNGILCRPHPYRYLFLVNETGSLCIVKHNARTIEMDDSAEIIMVSTMMLY